MSCVPWSPTMSLHVRVRAQDVVEYGVLIAGIVVIVLLGVTAFGHQIDPWFASLARRITTMGT